MNEHDYQRFLSDAEGCDSETSTPGALTREAFIKELNVVNQLMTADITELLAHDAALRATITQQAQELERVTKELNHQTRQRAYEFAASQKQAQELGRCKSEKNDAVIELYRKLDAKDAELAASQARCRELEREIKSLTTCGCEGCDDNLEESAFCLPCMNKVQKQVTQLQTTLAAREARIHDLERGLAAVLQVLQPFTEAQQARGSSGGAANQGAGT